MPTDALGPVVRADAPDTSPLPPVSRELRARLAVTVGVVALLAVGFLVPFPGTADMAGAVAGPLPPDLSVLAIGLFHFPAAFALVELLAALIPPLQRRRVHGMHARRPLLWASLALGLALSLFGAWSIGMVFVDPSPVMMLVLGGGTLAALMLANAATRFALGHGFPLVLAVTFTWSATLALWFMAENGGEPRYGPVIAGVLGVVVVTVLMLDPTRWLPEAIARHGRGPGRLPVAGLHPVLPITMAVSVVMLAIQWIAPSSGLFDTLSSWVFEAPGDLVLIAISTVFFGLLYYQPRRMADVIARLGDGQVSRRALTRRLWMHLLQLMVGSIVALFVLSLIAEWAFGADTFFATVMPIAYATAFVSDARTEWVFRRRHGAVARVWELQRVYAAAPAIDALADIGVSAHARSVSVRSLVPFLGSYVPIEILVPTSDRAVALAYLEDRLGEHQRALDPKVAGTFD